MNMVYFVLQMSVNCPVVKKALQALDITDSGIVSYDDLKSVLSSFLFSVDHNSFLGLLNRYEIDSFVKLHSINIFCMISCSKCMIFWPNIDLE